MSKVVSKKVVVVGLTIASLVGFFSIVFAWRAAAGISATSSLMNPFNAKISDAPAIVRQKPARQTVKGVYLTAYSANNPKKIDEIIKLIEKTELNAVVIDIKDYTGYVLYDSQLPLVKKYKTKRAIIKDPIALIQKLHDHGVYVIARQTVFQDPVLAEAEPKWSLQSKNGGLWRDHKWLAWVDAAKKEVWDYNVAVAKEAIGFGFDEVNFDYVRFPSDGNLATVKFSHGSKKKFEVMGEFYSYLSSALKDEPAWISLDMFGFVMEKKGTDDMNIGQRLADAVNVVDYVCPMMYPSHYPSGHLGLSNPAAFPQLVFEHGMTLGMPWFDNTRAEVRPWIQAFNMGAIYDGTKIRAQIDEVEKFASAGWLMWNASNRYTAAGLKSKDAVEFPSATSTGN